MITGIREQDDSDHVAVFSRSTGPMFVEYIGRAAGTESICWGSRRSKPLASPQCLIRMRVYRRVPLPRS